MPGSDTSDQSVQDSAAQVLPDPPAAPSARPGLTTSMLAASARGRSTAGSLGSYAYREIRERIVRLTLPPASLIDENQLAAELQVGLTPIRQALRRLSLENLVVILPRRGTLVADLNMSDLQKVFEMRLELESLAARLAAQRATPEQIAGMEAQLAEEAMPAGLTGYERNEALLRMDQEAHLLLADAAHNEFLWETLEWLYCHVLRLWYVALPRVRSLDEAIAEHRQIVAAVKAGDSAQAEAIMRLHISNFQDEVADLL